MTITTSARRLALVAVAALIAALLPFSVASAQDPAPDPDPVALDLDGQTNVEYSTLWSQVVYDDDHLAGADAPARALIGRDDIFADSLASGVLQDNVPLLLTPSDALAEGTLNELQRLGVDDVTILGLEAAVSEEVAADLEAEGFNVDRLGGATRIETAIEIAETVDSDTAILARAFANDDPTQAFADSLAAGGWAAESGFPVLLTQTEVLTGNTAAHIEAAGYDNIIIVGGDAAVSDEVEAEVSELVGNVTREAGATRFETAVAIAEARGYASPDDAEGVILVDGQGANAWADGFPAANLSGMGWPIVLSNSADTQLPDATVEWLEGGTPPPAAFAEHLTDVVLICGSTVPDGDEPDESDQCTEAADILGATVVDFLPPGVEPPPPVSNQDFDVTPTEAATNTVGDTRQYTVTGIDAETVDIVLASCDDFTVDENGVVTFVDEAPDNNRADLSPVGPLVAQVTVINGVVTTNTDEVGVIDGSVTFTVESTGAGCYVPLVFADADDDDALDLDDDDVPTELFGVGGQTTILPEELGEGDSLFCGLQDPTVIDVDTDEDFFTVDVFVHDGQADFLLNFVTGDSFNYAGLPITQAQFEQFLSEGDVVEVINYNPGASQFNVCDDVPNAPTNVQAEAGDFDGVPATDEADDIRVTWADATGGRIASYDVSLFEDDADATTDCSAGTQVGATQNVAAADPNEAVFTDLPNDTYCAVVEAISQTGDASDEAESDPVTVQVGTADETAPLITNADLILDGGTPAVIDAGDTFVLDFSEDITIDGNSVIRITDAEGGLFDVICDGVAATCTIGDDGDADAFLLDRVTVVVIVNPTPAGGTNPTPGAQIPATVTAFSAGDFEDLAGNPVDLANSPDRIIDNEI